MVIYCSKILFISLPYGIVKACFEFECGKFIFCAIILRNGWPQCANWRCVEGQVPQIFGSSAVNSRIRDACIRQRMKRMSD